MFISVFGLFLRGLCWVCMSEAESSTLRTTTVASETECWASPISAATTTGESTSTSREAACLPETATTTTTHHVEEDLRVNATHAAAHSSHAAHAATEHVGRINEVIAIVIACLLSVELLAQIKACEACLRYLLRVAQAFVSF
jgi:hypothetical protein